MSRADAPTRRSRVEQRAATRERLLDAATAAFAQHGIGSTSIEEIAEAAGYTRGAFYSNFADKDALVVALLDRHVERNIAELSDFAERDATGARLLQHLTAQSADRSDARRDVVVLNHELWLYAVRRPQTRERLAEMQQAIQDAVQRIIEAQAETLGLVLPFPAVTLARMVCALGDGIGFHTLIDPGGHPPDLFATTLADLRRAIVALAHEEAEGRP